MKVFTAHMYRSLSQFLLFPAVVFREEQVTDRDTLLNAGMGTLVVWVVCSFKISTSHM